MHPYRIKRITLFYYFITLLKEKSYWAQMVVYVMKY